LCPELSNKSSEKKGEAVPATNLSTSSSAVVFLQTMLVYLEGPKDTRCVRDLIDRAADRSYITKKAVEVLGFKSVGDKRLTHAVFGGDTSSVKIHQVHQVKILSVSNNRCLDLRALDQETI